MTMLPMWKKCPKCHRMYSWNPDVGMLFCPYCSKLGNAGDRTGAEVVKKILEIVMKDDGPPEKRKKIQ